MTEELKNASEADIMDALADDGDYEAGTQDDAARDLDDGASETDETKAEAESEIDDDLDAAPDAQEAEDAAADQDADEAERVEWGEGDATKSATLDELIAAYESPPAPDYDAAPQVVAKIAELDAAREQVTQAMVQESQRYMTGLQSAQTQLEQAFALIPQPQAPDPNLALTDPMAYNQQLAQFQQASAAQAQLAQQYQANQAQLDAETRAAQQREAQQEQAAMQAEMAKLQAAWPEAIEADTIKAVQGLAAEYGLSPAELGEIADHRFFLMARDLLASREASAKAGPTAEKLKSKSAPRRVTARKGGSAALDATARLKAKIASGGRVSNAEAMESLEEAMS